MTCYAGYDQHQYSSSTPANFTGKTLLHQYYVGGNSTTADSQMNHGSMLRLHRAGMTLADALAIVQKMQTLHGIS